MSALNSTPAGQYLKDRFGFQFTDEPAMKHLETAVFAMALDVSQLRNQLKAAVRREGDEQQYVRRSLEREDAAVYEPLHEGRNIPALVRRLNESERWLGLFLDAIAYTREES